MRLCAIFDSNKNLVGQKVKGIEVKDIVKLEEYLSENKVSIGIICVPKENAQEVCDRMTNNGIKGIWNFAPIDLEVATDVRVENVHLSESLHTLSFLISSKEKENR